MRNTGKLYKKQYAAKIAAAALFLSAVLAWMPVAQLKAQGNLLITPRRVVFERQKKTQELNLANTGKDTARYVISMIEIRMKEDGSFEQVTEPDSSMHTASEYVRFFPRSVTLAPNEVQVVKMQVVRTGQLSPGEYRSHIYFRAVPAEKPLGEQQAVRDASGIAVQLTPVFGITLPVIIRVGAPSASINLSQLQFKTDENNTPSLSMLINRAGSMSVYGDLAVDFVTATGKATRVASVKGIAVYTSTPSRQFSVSLDKKGIDYSRGKLHVVYTSNESPKSAPLAEAELLLN
jgi:hypothetical protein